MIVGVKDCVDVSVSVTASVKGDVHGYLDVSVNTKVGKLTIHGSKCQIRSSCHCQCYT